MPTELVAPPVEPMPDADPDTVEGEGEKPAETPEVKNKRIAKAVKDGLAPARRTKKDLHNEWKRNVELRLGRIGTAFPGGVAVEDQIQSEINPDWSLTNTKTANLFSQVPNVQGSHDNKQYAPAVAPFMKALNFELSEKRTNIGTVVEEVLNDVVNAAGVGAVLVGYTARFEKVPMPMEESVALPGLPGPIPTNKLNEDQLKRLAAAGLVHMQDQDRVVSDRFDADRISPNDLLWPSEFTRSDFDLAPWTGYEGQAMWADAVHDFKLDPAKKDEYLGAGNGRRETEDLRQQADKSLTQLPVVRYTRLFYWRAKYDEDETQLRRIWEIVYVDGEDDPAVHEEWKGQRYDEQTRKLIGCQRMPLRFLTLNYITDNPIPPSDTSAGRPQVQDLRRSRSIMFDNRQRSVPARWYDSNRIDHTLGALLQRGTVQGWIPTNGDGGRALGEIARASYPSEDFTFDQMSKNDLIESWGLDATLVGMKEGRMPASQATAGSQARAARIGRERNRVSKWFLGICECIAGLMVLYSDFPSLTEQEKTQMQQVWDQKHIVHEVVLKIRPNSTVVMDPQARVQQLMQFMNFTVKSGFVSPKPIITEIAEWSDIDPSEVIVDPKPKEPDEPSISWRLTGKDDLHDPVVAAMMMKHKQMPSPQEIEMAKKMLFAAQQPLQPESPAPDSAGEEGAPSAAHPPAAGGGPVQGAPNGEAHEGWTLGSRVAKRSRDVSGG